MKATRTLTLSCILALGAGSPALAAWDDIGSVDVNYARDRDVREFEFGGPVERLRLRATGSDINCRGVDATFGNGHTRTIFDGRLREGRARNIDLPGDDRRITRLAFRCGAEEGSGGTIQIMADVGRYRNDWRRAPQWSQTWSRIFNWGSEAVNNWQYLGSERFTGRYDRERAYAGWNGRNIDAVALKPVGADARCARVTAVFRNGQTSVLNAGTFLREGEYHKLDVPGDTRNLSSLSMLCTAVNAQNVTMQIYTSR